MSSLEKITCIEDLHRVYRQKVPKMFVDYCDSGSWTQSTYRHNESDFADYLFRQKVLVDMDNRSLATSLLGQDYQMPLIIAPMGMLGMQHANGEMLAAQAAEKMGIPFTLSTMSICSIEDVASVTTKPFWFQLYMMRDKAFMENLIARAKAAKCSALVLTADLQIMGQRHQDIKNGLSAPPKPTLKNLLNLALKPEWCLNMAKTNKREFRNIVGHAQSVSDMSSLASWSAEQFDPCLSWNDVAWVKERWDGPLIIKGIMEVDDAKRAVDAGADAIVVSNHGGRQLDSAPSSIRVLSDITEAVATQTEVYLDSVIRTGQDILKAVALGAKGVMSGRAMLYGLGAYGQAGVEKAIALLYKEMDLSMAFCGKTNVNQIDNSILR
jgi:L-lactate dehydrogenase (cytochrome)